MFFWTAAKSHQRGGAALDVFQQGADARLAGRRLSDNPYCVAVEAHREWAEGWRATLDLDEDDDIDSCRDRADRVA